MPVPIGSAYFRDGSFVGVVKEVRGEAIAKLDSGITLVLGETLRNNDTFFLHDSTSHGDIAMHFLGSKSCEFEKVHMMGDKRYFIKISSNGRIEVRGNKKEACISLSVGWWKLSLGEIVSLALGLGDCRPEQRTTRMEVLLRSYEDEDIVGLVNVKMALSLYRDIFQRFYSDYEKEIATIISDKSNELRRLEAQSAAVNIVESLKYRATYMIDNAPKNVLIKHY